MMEFSFITSGQCAADNFFLSSYFSSRKNCTNSPRNYMDGSIDYDFNINFLYILLTLLIPAVIFIPLRNIFCKTTAKTNRTLTGSNITFLHPLAAIKTITNGLCYINDMKKMAYFFMEKHGRGGWGTNIFGKDIIILNNAPMIQKLLSSGDNGHLQRPAIVYHKLLPGSVFKSSMLVSEVNFWKSHRGVINRAFTYDYIKNYIKGFTEDSEDFIVSLDSKINDLDDNAVSFSSLLFIHTLGMISRVVTGSNIISHGDGSTFHTSFERYKELSSYRAQYPWLMLDFVWKLHPNGREMNGLLRKLETIIDKSLKRLKTNGNHSVENRTFLDKEKIDESEDGKEDAEQKSVMNVMMKAGFSDAEIFAEVLSLMLAGHETVSMTINFLMLNLALNPQFQIMCRQEVDEIFQRFNNEKDKSLNQKLFTMESLSDLKYLERCIKETMRIFPALPAFSREISSPLKLDENTEISAGSLIMVFPWFLHRNSEYYSNPEKFDPDRFLPENCLQRSSHAYQPFSNGPRNCIGNEAEDRSVLGTSKFRRWKMALCKMKILAAFILRHYEVHTTDRLEDIRIQYRITIAPHKPLNIKLKRRPDVAINKK